MRVVICGNLYFVLKIVFFLLSDPEADSNKNLSENEKLIKKNYR